MITTTTLSFAGSAFAGATVGCTAGTAVGSDGAAGSDAAGADAAGADAAGSDAAGAAGSLEPPHATTKAANAINRADIKNNLLMPCIE